MTKREKLNNLYLQKRKIEEEISVLEQQLQTSNSPSVQSFTKDEKIDLFESLFIGRFDIYAKLWQNKEGTKSRYYPVTKTFQSDDYIPLKSEQIELHLRGEIDIASYMIAYKNQSKYMVICCDAVYLNNLNRVLKNLKISFCCEYHDEKQHRIWIFFNEFINLRVARAYVSKILTQAQCEAKILPKEDFSNQSNLGSMIALPLQRKAREQNMRCFVDIDSNSIIDDPWEMFSLIQKVSLEQIQTLINIEDINTQLEPLIQNELVFPAQLELTLYDYIYIPLQNLGKSLIEHLKRFAMFENPQIKILQQLRKPLYNTPRTLKGYDEDEYFLKLPRGLYNQIISYLKTNGVNIIIKDKRLVQEESFSNVVFEVRSAQQKAIAAVLKHDCCLCVAPPGFGKTFIGANIIAKRGVNTLILVHKNMLLDQWIERFVEYFGIAKKEIGYLGKGKNKLNSKLDVATMQSLKNHPELIEEYTQVIVDECHHLPAVTFEQIIKLFHGKYILGLSATPNRKDELQPIIFQQIGPIAYEHKNKRTSQNTAHVIKSNFISQSETFAELINEIVGDEARNQMILEQIIQYRQRRILVLTDRIEHISNLEILSEAQGLSYVSVHGSLSKKEQNENMQKVHDAHLVFATASFFGEGIDFPHLDTIVFATPISYYGRLVQYLGRIGRNGSDCLAIDILDNKNAMLNSMYKKRKPGYKQMHYSIVFE